MIPFKMYIRNVCEYTMKLCMHVRSCVPTNVCITCVCTYVIIHMYIIILHTYIHIYECDGERKRTRLRGNY